VNGENVTVNINVFINHILTRVGGRVLNALNYTGGVALLSYRSLTYILMGRLHWGLILNQIHALGVRSLSLTNLVAIFTGMVFALQFIVGLKRFGLQLYVGQVVGIAIVRELGPVLTALMMAARVGSGIAAELGSMTVTEQVLAIRAMGANPIIKLVVPRVLVVTIVTPLLTVIADVVGILGGMVVTIIEAGVSPRFYLDQVIRTVHMDDFVSGVGKTFFFGFLIGVIACYQGLKTTRGTEGVGQATTMAVVVSSVAVFVADYFLTKIFLYF
jgi:phospholipid/cholesterol/gamma-HCH transport system permease protein